MAPCRDSQTLTDPGEQFPCDQLNCLGRKAFRHAGPFGAHYQMICSDATVEGQDLVGNFVRRSDQETIADQTGELLVEAAVVGRQFLPPRVVRLVFRAEVWSAEADRLVPRTGDKHLSPHWQFGGERLASGVERAPIEFHLPFDRADFDRRPDIPAVTEARRALYRDIGIRTDPNRGMRPLQWFRQAGRCIEFEVRCPHRELVFGPQRSDGDTTRLEATRALCSWHT